MAEKGMGIPDTFLHALSVRALSDEYGHVKGTLQVRKNCDRAEIMRMVGTRYSTLPQMKGSQRSSRPPSNHLFSRKRGGLRGARRGCGRGCRYTQGRDRGGNCNKGGGSSSGRGSSSASSASGSGHGGSSRPPGRFWPREEHIIIGRGGAGDWAADLRKGSRRGNPGVRSEEKRKVQSDVRGRSRGEWWSRGAYRIAFESSPQSLGHTTSQGGYILLLATCIPSGSIYTSLWSAPSMRFHAWYACLL